jgi:hypothetical protein
MEKSILISVKKLVGLGKDDHSYDEDILTHINSDFTNLNRLGAGPVDGFTIEDEVTVWTDYLPDNKKLLSSIKSYMYLKVRLLFDPPSSSYVLDSMKRQIDEFEFEINSEADKPVIEEVTP